MSQDHLQLQIISAGRCEHEFAVDGLVECGRQDAGEPKPFTVFCANGRNRLVLATSSEQLMPRRWFELSVGPEHSIRLRNLHGVVPVRLGDGTEVLPGESCVLPQGRAITLNDSLGLQVSAASLDSLSSEGEMRSLQSVLPDDENSAHSAVHGTVGDFHGPNAKAVAALVKIALNVVSETVSSNHFIQSAARATTEIVKLDRAVILRRDGIDTITDIDLDSASSVSDAIVPDGWKAMTQFVRKGISTAMLPSLSRTMLDSVVETESTLIHEPTLPTDPVAHSLQEIHCAVAAPIRDTGGRIVAVLYGDRWVPADNHGASRLTDLEGTLVDMVAGSIASGLARIQEAKFRNNLSGFFSPRVSELLARDRSLLDGQEMEVSVLFCDIRGFSAVTENLGPTATIRWINDVLGELSQNVVELDGVLVDYVGDELMAMWGAPGAQPDHADRALQCARRMLDSIEVLRDRWSDTLPQRFGAGIGVNTGIARVGNVGSAVKFKYGVLGNTVNFGSRLQSATKQMGVSCLCSDPTLQAANERVRCRRIAKLGLVGIQQAVDAYQIPREESPAWHTLCDSYDAALQDYEQQSFGSAARILGEILQNDPTDRPSMLLLSRTLEQMANPSSEFTPVWRFDQK